MRAEQYATPAFDSKARQLGWRRADEHQWFREFDPKKDTEFDDECPETGKRTIFAFNSKAAVEYDS